MLAMGVQWEVGGWMRVWRVLEEEMDIGSLFVHDASESAPRFAASTTGFWIINATFSMVGSKEE
jgi:hypothetical protein